MSLTFKAFLYENTWRGDPVEIRRFTIDQDVSSSHAYLVQKVVQVFPSLKAGNFILAWTDADGDVITISSDEELVEALDQFEGNVFRLLLKKSPSAATSQENPQSTQGPSADAQSSTTQGPSFHPGVVCDECNGQIYGTRFKCLVCRDYDLCSGCEGKGVHVGHNMLSIATPWSYCPWGGFQQCRPRGGGRCGPYRGRGGCRGGRFGGHPFPGGSRPCAGGQGPFAGGNGPFGGGSGPFAPWWQGFSQWFNPQGKPEGQEPMDTEQKPGGEEKPGEEKPGEESAAPCGEEQRKTFLRGVGEAVSNFLEPYGIKVDVDVLSGAEQTKPASEAAGETDQKTEVSDETIEDALAQLRSMGYQDEGGWLMELVRAKGGDIAKVLDALHPSVDQD